MLCYVMFTLTVMPIQWAEPARDNIVGVPGVSNCLSVCLSVVYYHMIAHAYTVTILGTWGAISNRLHLRRQLPLPVGPRTHP